MRSVVSAFAFSAEHGQDGDSRRDWQDGLAALAVLQGHKSGQCPYCGKECGGKAHACDQAWAKKHGQSVAQDAASHSKPQGATYSGEPGKQGDKDGAKGQIAA